MILPRRRFLGSSVLLGGALLDVLTTPVWRWRPGTLLQAETKPPTQPSPVQFIDIADKAGLTTPNVWGGVDRKHIIIETKGSGIAFFDYDNDGWLDIYLTNGSRLDAHWPAGQAPTTHLYRNNRDGTFTDVSTASGTSDPEHRYALTAVWSDFDNNGKLDLLVTNDGEPNYLYQGDGAGHFRDVGFTSGVALNVNGAAQANMGVALGDYLHNGRTDIFLSHFDNEYGALYRNDGDMTFTEVSASSSIAAGTAGYVGWGDAFVDFSNDGWPDLFVVNGHVYPQVDTGPEAVRYREPKLLFLNERNGRFRNLSKLVGPAIQTLQVSRGMAVGDLFNDGRVEAVVENLTGEPMILRPEGGPPNHWISFVLEGTIANRLALNARVQASAGNLVQTGEVLSGGSYVSQNDLRLHFGLGEHSTVDQAKIFWPDGKVEVLRNLPADRLFNVREGSGVVASTSPGK